MLKSDVIWPNSRRFKSRTEWEPLGFFSEALCNSTQFDLKLGFFSSSAINVLADGFAAFLYNGGKMRMVINDILSAEDKRAMIVADSGCDMDFFDLQDLGQIRYALSKRNQHFFDCLAWLIRHNRIEIKVVAPKSGEGIAHSKCGVFNDGLNRVAFDGSCNFSKTALISNIESITAFCDWDGQGDIYKIQDVAEDFEKTFSGEDESVTYLDSEHIRTHLTNTCKDKEIQELLEDEAQLISDRLLDDIPKTVASFLTRAKNNVNAILERIQQNEKKAEKDSKPRFPYLSGPRDYQNVAFENWKANKQKGLFAMATGTGKTITSLNCLLEIYKKLGYYKALILVPTITLVEQWEKECKKFNFDRIIKVCSKYSDWKSSIGNIRLLEQSNPSANLSYIIISTYASFVRPNIFDELNSLSKKRLLLIADEAHNMGGGRVALRLNDIVYLRRIGLSATPERQFDEAGNIKLSDFFGCKYGYTFEYSMAEAIRNKALCKYFYYPHLVELTDDEMAEYVVLSKKIAKMFNNDDPDSQDIVKRLLLKRKRIIHKAENKKEVFEQILRERINVAGSLKYTLVYAPEGNTPDDHSADIFDLTDTISEDMDSVHLIEEYTRIVRDIDPHIVVRQFTGDTPDRESILKAFAEGEIDVLTSMKCLDEGLDVPRSELAIFCSSTGNPRQFVQRRGRVLRTHSDKKFAVIHDLIVVPNYSFDTETYELEKSLVGTEIKRVRDFALLSENCNDTLNVLDEVLTRYNISIFE